MGNQRFVAADEAHAEVGDLESKSSKAERVFMHLLDVFTRQRRHVSSSTGPTHAPSQFADHSQAEGVGKRQFATVMEVLLSDGRIVVEEHGPASKRRKHLALAPRPHGCAEGEE